MENRDVNSIRYKILMSVFSIFLFLLPLTLLKDHIIKNLKTLIDTNKSAIHSSLISEAEEFKNDLEPVKRLKKIIKKTEERIGLISSSSAHLQFLPGLDPNIIHRNFIQNFCGRLHKDYGLKPLCIFATDYQSHNCYSRYDEKYFQTFSSEQKLCLSQILLVVESNTSLVSELISKHTTVFRLLLSGAWTEGSKENLRVIITSISKLREYYMQRIFSPTYYNVNSSDYCKEFLTRNFDSSNIYIYKKLFHDNNILLGGYIAIFTNKEFNHKHTIALEQKNNIKTFKREISTYAYLTDFVMDDNRFYYSRPIPSSLKIASQIDMSDKRLVVSVSCSKLIYNLNSFIKLITFLYRLLLILVFTGIIKYILFGFCIRNTLKQQIITIIAIMLILPYFSVGYFTNLIKQLITKSKQEQIQTEAKSKLFELESYVEDLTTNSLLRSMQLKLNLLSYLDNPNSKFIFKGLFARIEVFQADGKSFMLRSSRREKANEFRDAKCAVAFNLLGKSDANSKLVAKKLRLAMMSSVVLSNDILDKITCFSYELQETSDFAQLSSNTSLYPMILSSLSNSKKIQTIVLALVKNKDLYLNYFNALLPHKILNSNVGQFNTVTALALNQNDYVNTNSIFPSYLKANTPLKKILFRAIESKSNAILLKPYGMKNAVGAWSFSNANNKTIALGVITKFKNNLLSNFIIKLLPLILFVVSILSIILLSDLLSVILAYPLTFFVKAINLLELGDYDVYISLNSCDEFATFASAINIMASGLLQKEKMRRFVSRRLIEKIETGVSIIPVEKTEVVILSSDIRNFTSLSENYDPSEIVKLLNIYFTSMEKAIVDNGGIIEKFVGDALIAVFYKATEKRQNCHSAVNAAFEMRKSLDKINIDRSSKKQFTIENGIGISSGNATVGVAGSKTGRNEFVVFGEVVTLADKLEASTKLLENTKIAVDIIVKTELINYFIFSEFEIDDLKAYEVIHAKST